MNAVDVATRWFSPLGTTKANVSTLEEEGGGERGGGRGGEGGGEMGGFGRSKSEGSKTEE